MTMTRLITFVLIGLLAWFLFTVAKNSATLISETDHYKLASAINGTNRSESNKARDVYRHPAETLNFFKLNPNMTVVEIWPGKGWYTEIIAPYIKSGNGRFIVAGFPFDSGPEWRKNMARDYQQWLKATPEFYEQVSLVELGPPSSWQIADDNSIDIVLTFRNVHNWLTGGYEAEMFRSFYKALKPGGILGITEHRASAGTGIEQMKKTGYVTEKLVIKLAEDAGFVLEEKSEINANPRDSKDHPKGVWTLPPTLRLGEQDRDKYLAIGESDRMTLRFRKPLD